MRCRWRLSWVSLKRSDVPTLSVYDYWECPDANGVMHSAGSRSAPQETSVNGLVEHRTIQLATATSLTLWTSAGAITSFEFFWIKSTQALKLELTVDRGGEVGSEEIVLLIPANKAFRLSSDDALANYSGTLSGGTSDVVDEIICRNESGSTANIEYAIID